MKLDQRSISPRGPASSEKPSTSNRLPTTEPVSDPRTTSVSPSCTAMSAMISSGAFPKVALRKPPIPGPVCSAACSVASPISQARGMRAMRGEHELDGLVEVGEVVQRDRERPDQKTGEEDAADHERTLPASVTVPTRVPTRSSVRERYPFRPVTSSLARAVAAATIRA